MKRLRRNVGKGFTLIEALIAASVLAMAIAAITMPFTVGAQNELADSRRTLAVSLAQEMMEEILDKPFIDPQGSSKPGPEPGENLRSAFDNIDDYNEFVELPGKIADMSGVVNSEPASTGLSRHVAATYVYVSGQDASNDPTFVRVTVEIRYRDQVIITLTRLVYAVE